MVVVRLSAFFICFDPGIVASFPPKAWAWTLPSSPRSLLDQRRGREVDAKAATPDGHRVKLAQVEIRGQFVVLISPVALNRTQWEKTGIGHGCVVFGIAGHA